MYARRLRTVAAILSVMGASILIASCGGFAKNSNPKADTIFSLIPAPPSPAEAVRWAVDPYDADKRQRGILLLANAPFGGEEPYMEMYTLATEDGDPAVRAVAVRAFALHGGPDSAPLLADILTNDEAATARREAARALQRIHNVEVVETLMAALDPSAEEDPDTRAYAATALGQYAEPRVVQALIGALQDRRLAVNHAALESLKTLTGEDYGLFTRRWLAWTNETKELFAGRTQYVYPVFHRDPTIVELILPWFDPPNEKPGSPAGMPAQADAGSAVANDSSDNSG